MIDGYCIEVDRSIREEGEWGSFCCVGGRRGGLGLGYGER